MLENSLMLHYIFKEHRKQGIDQLRDVEMKTFCHTVLFFALLNQGILMWRTWPLRVAVAGHSLSLDISDFHVLTLNFHMFIVVFYRKVNCWNVLNHVPTKELSERSCKAFAHVISHFELTHLHQHFKLRWQILLMQLLRIAATGFIFCHSAKDFFALKVQESKVNLVLAGFTK